MSALQRYTELADFVRMLFAMSTSLVQQPKRPRPTHHPPEQGTLAFQLYMVSTRRSSLTI
jgi:hypothetical protein